VYDAAMKKLLIYTLAIVTLVIAVGAAQVYIFTPTRGCKEFAASEKYTGYVCKSKTLYIAN
jgi:hypothetical protein